MYACICHSNVQIKTKTVEDGGGGRGGNREAMTVVDVEEMEVCLELLRLHPPPVYQS